jgi:hypothetical protein
LSCWQLALAGCGSAEPYPVPVHGTVRLDGQMLAEGQIAFITPGQVPETVEVKDGRYAGKVKWGERRVEIAAYRPYQLPADAPAHLRPLMAQGKENYLPERYHRNSILKAEVKTSGDNEFHYELLSK